MLAVTMPPGRNKKPQYNDLVMKVSIVPRIAELRQTALRTWINRNKGCNRFDATPKVSEAGVSLIFLQTRPRMTVSN
jgi:hypothetical protein